MAIEAGDFVRLTYTGKLEDGKVFDTTDEELAKAEGIYNEDATYGGDVVIVGAGHTIKGLEEDVVGRDVGYEGEAVVSPEKGFGERDSEKIKVYSTTKFENPREGMRVNIEGNVGTISRIVGRRARVDFNHPLAGKTLHYTYRIEDKVEDEVEKVRGLIALHVPEVPDVSIEGGVARVAVPEKLTYDLRWLRSKAWIARQIIENVGMKKVVLEEVYTADDTGKHT
ncbi:MAG: FKBP-type peptidyl-prolyl cis-trans isomerase [Methermicoccaceae archaeon]